MHHAFSNSSHITHIYHTSELTYKKVHTLAASSLFEGCPVVRAMSQQASSQVVFHALNAGDGRRLSELLKESPALATLKDGTGHSLLGRASLNGDVFAVKSLLDAGSACHVNDGNAVGHTPLHAAAYRGNDELVRLLLEHGADVSKVGEDGRTPLMMACMRGHADIIDILLKKSNKVRKLRLLEGDVGKRKIAEALMIATCSLIR